MDFFGIIGETFARSGFANLSWQQGVMLLISFVLLYCAIVKGFEPLLLLPIAFGMMLANLPDTGIMHDATEAATLAVKNASAALAADPSNPALVTELANAQAQLSSVHWYDSGVLKILHRGVKSSIFPCLIFMGVGAMTDFGPLLANPISLLLGAAAQLGIYIAFIFANAITIGGEHLFTAAQAAAIGIIGGADGPTAIFVINKLAPELLSAIAVAAYSYMALIPLIQPPIMKALTTQKERTIKMGQLRKVTKTEKIIFPIVVSCVVIMLIPDTASLIGMLMLGNLFREAGCVERLSDTAQNALCNIVTIMLGTTVGATADGATFLSLQTIGIVVMGLAAFCFSTAGGVLLGKLLCLLTGGKINPLIGSAGVSAVPMAARVSQVEGRKYNPTNFLLMHAMGPNVAGVIGSAVAAGFLLLMFKG